MGAGIGVGQFQIGNDRDILLHRFERTENGGKLVQLLATWRRPSSDVTTHWHENITQSAHGFGRRFFEGGCRGNHRVEKRQREGGSDAFEKSSTRESFLCNNHNASRILNGMLFTIPRIIDEIR